MAKFISWGIELWFWEMSEMPVPCCDQHQGHAKDPGLYTNSSKGDTFGEFFINVAFFSCLIEFID
jgi:hypothetical protein